MNSRDDENSTPAGLDSSNLGASAPGTSAPAPGTSAPASELPQLLGPGSYRCATPEATHRLGEALGSCLESGDLVILSGDLGAGKTCFTGGVAAALGDTRPVTSPTFTIMSIHDQGRLPLYHFDLYRLDDAEQLGDAGVYDALDSDGACLVEWGERFSEELGQERLDLDLRREQITSDASEPARLITAHAYGQRAEELLAQFDHAVLDCRL